MKTTIPILFSEEDADLAALHWYYDGDGYGRRTSKHRILRAHRVVLERALGRPLTPDEVCDHVNGNRIDNRRENLRPATRQQNTVNSQMRPRPQSGYRGVTFHKVIGKWQAQIKCGGRSQYLGVFDDAAAAAAVYDARATELYGQFAVTNSDRGAA